ncbi:MAG TPA: hypothetical protein VHT73_06235 [Thermodesulfobacteriota bacterium]|nr:hypothetical protein [Thermodesulfobacteriota bacterium]
MPRDDRQTKILEEQLKRMRERLRPIQENITVRRRIVDKVNGRLCYTFEYDRERKVYVKLDPPVPASGKK